MVYTRFVFTRLLVFGAAFYVVLVGAVPIDTNLRPSLVESAVTSTPTSNSHTPTPTSLSLLSAATPSPHPAAASAQSNAQHATEISFVDYLNRPFSEQDSPVLLPAKAANAPSDAHHTQPHSAQDLHRPLSEQGPPVLQHERTSAPSHARHPTPESSFPEDHRLPSEHGPPVLPHDSEQTSAHNHPGPTQEYSFLNDLNSPLSPERNHPPEASFNHHSRPYIFSERLSFSSPTNTWPIQFLSVTLHLSFFDWQGMNLGDSHSHRQGTAVSNDHWPGTVSSHDNQLDMGHPSHGHLQSTVPSSHGYQQNTDPRFGSWFGLSQPIGGTMYGNSHPNTAPSNVQTYNTQPTGQIHGHPHNGHLPFQSVPSNSAYNGDMGMNMPMDGNRIHSGSGLAHLDTVLPSNAPTFGGAHH
ncbi:hypothetical protein EV360DRAFT_70908 [Lentinula raphanica]|nr:hypothetical protein EV360DRAFT_70908 [Lentinula raphanica]